MSNPIDDAARLAAIVAYSDDAIVSKDLNGIVQTWNRSAERIFGYPAEEAIGRSITLIIPEDRLHEEAEVFRRIRAGLTVEHYETIRRRKDGTLVDISLTVSPIRSADGVIVGASKIARDISEQKRLRLQLEQTSRMKDEFLATLSHELRTPLNAVVGWAHMLANEDLPAESIRRGAQAILRNAQAQADIVADLLDVSRIVTGSMRLSLERIAVGSFIREAVDVVQPAADAKRVRIEVDGTTGVELRGDPVRLRQIVWNLLSNAVKFTPAGGSIRISVETDGDQVSVAVTDTGQGISPAFMPYIFDRFRQEDPSLSRSAGGLGLGLSIVKHLVEAHGGRIEVASEGTGRGTTFTVRLPLALSARAQPT